MFDALVTYTVGSLAVLIRTQLRCVLIVVGGMQVMPVSNFGMMRCFLVIARLVVLGGFTMVFRSMLVVVRGLFVMFVNVVLVQILVVHRSLPCLLD
jgi:hypothetical protein